jgi:hypothetical protein
MGGGDLQRLVITRYDGNKTIDDLHVLEYLFDRNLKLICPFSLLKCFCRKYRLYHTTCEWYDYHPISGVIF